MCCSASLTPDRLQEYARDAEAAKQVQTLLEYATLRTVTALTEVSLRVARLAR